MNFSPSSTTAANLTFLSGGTVATTSNASSGTGNTNINANVNITANNAMTLNVNNGTFNQNGSISSTADPLHAGAGGTINVLSTGTLNIPSITNISVDAAAANALGGTLNINATGALSIANGTLNANGKARGCRS